jgi:hypothetical protein
MGAAALRPAITTKVAAVISITRAPRYQPSFCLPVADGVFKLRFLFRQCLLWLCKYILTIGEYD